MVLGLGFLSACRTDDKYHDDYYRSTSASQAPYGVGTNESDRTAQVDTRRERWGGETSRPENEDYPTADRDTTGDHRWDRSTADTSSDRTSTGGMTTGGIESTYPGHDDLHRRTGDTGPQTMNGNAKLTATLVDDSQLASNGAATVQVSTTGIDLVDPASRNEQAKEGEGHLHYRIDDGPIVATTAQQLSFGNLPQGEHRITVALAGNDHKPIGEPQTLTANITGSCAKPGSMAHDDKDKDKDKDVPDTEKNTAYSERGDRTFADNGAATLVATLVDPAKEARAKAAVVMVKATGVELADPKTINAKPMASQGHVHYQVDDGPIVMTPLSKLSFHQLTPGHHTITVQLVDRNHAPIGQAQRLDVDIPNSNLGD